MDDPTDEQLVARYRAETDRPAARSLIDQLFQRHHTRVAAWCLRMTGQVDSAADLAQEILLKAFQRFDSYRGDAKFTTWLYSIARNHCMDQLRARSLRPDEISGPTAEDIADPQSEEAWRALERQESLASLRGLIRETLDEMEAKVMILHYVHELPLESITRLLGLTNQSGSKAYIVSARRKLNRALARRAARTSGPKGGGYGA